MIYHPTARDKSRGDLAPQDSAANGGAEYVRAAFRPAFIRG